MLNMSKWNTYLFLYYTLYARPLLTAVSTHSVISNAQVNHERTDYPVPAVDIHNPQTSTSTPRQCVQPQIIRQSSCFLSFFLQCHQHQPGTQNMSRNKLH